MTSTDLTLMQAARLKGRLRADLAELFDPAAAEGLSRLEQAGLLAIGPAGARLTPAGRDRLQSLLHDERSGIDQTRLRPLYAEFDEPNARLKSTITRWQVKPDGSANDHADSRYDRSVVGELSECHEAAAALIGRMVTVAPRLAHYPRRLSAALARAAAGDSRAVAHPLDDSYHQVWFELHEDLLSLLGLAREAEAMAGRAQ